MHRNSVPQVENQARCYTINLQLQKTSLPYFDHLYAITNKKIKTVIDTGAEISIIKYEAITEEAKLRIKDTPVGAIKGISNKEIKPIGVIRTQLYSMPVTFFVLKSNDISIPFDALLGMTTLQWSKIDFPNKILKFKHTGRGSKENYITLTMEESNNNTENEEENDDSNKIPKHLRTLAANIDKIGEEKRKPIQKTKTNITKEKLGTIEKVYEVWEEFSNYQKEKGLTPGFETIDDIWSMNDVSAECDTEDSTQDSTHSSEHREGGETENYVFNQDQGAPNVLYLKARSRNIVDFPCTFKGKVISEPKHLQEGVIVGSCLTKSNGRYARLPILNLNEEEIAIHPDEISEFLQPYEEYELEEQVVDKNADSQQEDRKKFILDELRKYDQWTSEQFDSVSRICLKYNKIFHLPDDQLSCCTKVKHEIVIKEGTAPIMLRNHRLNPHHKQIINETVKKLLQQGIVRPSSSPWSAPLIVVPKKPGPDGKPNWRVVVDYRKLNANTRQDAYPLPRIEDILDQLGDAEFYTTMDLESGYYQVPMAEKDMDKTAFNAPFGHYEFLKMPFGLTNGPATFQRMMNHALAGLQGIECLVYLDDIIVHGTTLSEHNERLEKVLERLRENNLKVKLSKCQFLRKEILFLGHKITNKGLEPDPTKVQAVLDFPAPSNKKKLQSFLGLANYYRKFIEGFADIAAPLNNLLKNKVKYNWTQECQEAFEKLKVDLTTEPVLIFPDYEKEFILTTDASNYALGAVLSQGEIGQDQPIAYASRSLSDTEKRYATIEKEMLAIVFAVKLFRCYLQNRRFTIYTDHQPLTGALRSQDTSSRLTNLLNKLVDFDYKIYYKPGKLNINADALSRLPYEDITEPNICVTTRSKAKIEKKVIDGNQNNKVVSKPKNADKQNHMTPSNINKNEIVALEDNEEIPKNTQVFLDSTKGIVDNPLGHEISDVNKQRNKKRDLTLIEQQRYAQAINIDNKEDQQQILREIHANPLGGHNGREQTFDKIRRQFNWKGLYNNVEELIKKCEECNRSKRGIATKMPLEITDTPYKPFEKVYLDIVGPLNTTLMGNKYILTFEDDFTKTVDGVALPDQEAATIAEAFVERIICRYALPERLITDKGANFESRLIKEICKILKIKKKSTTSYHPQSNGSLERSHRPLADYLRIFERKYPDSWDTFVAPAMFVKNTSVHASTKFTPTELLMGFVPRIPTSIKQKPQPIYNYDDYSRVMKFKLQEAHEIARENLIGSKYKAKEYYDKKCNEKTFKLGDMVRVRNEAKKGKLDWNWSEPAEIVEINSDNNVTVRLGRKTMRIHNNRLKKAFV